jgi:hypothetical protein
LKSWQWAAIAFVAYYLWQRSSNKQTSGAPFVSNAPGSTSDLGVSGNW